jgi:hypothetical protein
MYTSSTLVYILSVCDTSYISVYDALSDSFTEQFKLSSTTTIGLFDLYIGSSNIYIFGYWTPNGENAYIASAPTSDPTGHPHYESSTNQFAVTTSYPLISDVITGKSLQISNSYFVLRNYLRALLSFPCTKYLLFWSPRDCERTYHYDMTPSSCSKIYHFIYD